MKTTQQGIYVAPSDMKANKDRIDSGKKQILSKEEVVNKLHDTQSTINDLLTHESSVDNAKKLVAVSEVLNDFIRYVNQL